MNYKVNMFIIIQKIRKWKLLENNKTFIKKEVKFQNRISRDEKI